MRASKSLHVLSVLPSFRCVKGCVIWDFCRSRTAFSYNKKRFLSLETVKFYLLSLNKVNGNGISITAVNMLWGDWSQFIARNVTDTVF